MPTLRVGRTPWSAADALVGLLLQPKSRTRVRRGRGSPPHVVNLPRCVGTIMEWNRNCTLFVILKRRLPKQMNCFRLVFPLLALALPVFSQSAEIRIENPKP